MRLKNLIKHLKRQAVMPVFWLTGALGFEPRDGGTKTRCLTTWLRPNDFTLVNIAVRPRLLSSTFIVYFRQMIFTAQN